MTAGTGALLAAIGGGAAGVAILTRHDFHVVRSAAGDSALAAAPAVPAAPGDTAAGLSGAGAAVGARLGNAAQAATGDRTSDEADRMATRTPRRAPGRREPGADSGTTTLAQPAATAAAPAVTTQTETETRAIPYRTMFVRDPSLPRGRRQIQTPGVDGVQTLRWLVTFADGRETDRRLLGTSVTRQPQHQVIAFGSQGRGWGHGRPRECGADLEPCIPLSRPTCPDQAQIEEDGIQLGGSAALLGEDLALLSPADLAALPPGPAMPCP